jgi:Pyruvate/2-oxoacid:ferredoxin oxidoreductase gamma subunit
MTQNFGPEVRGGACSAQLVVSDSPVLYPYTTRPDIMVIMSQEAYRGDCTYTTQRERSAQSRGRLVPPSFRDLNLRAFEKGCEYGVEVLAKGPSRPHWEALAVTEE